VFTYVMLLNSGMQEGPHCRQIPTAIWSIREQGYRCQPALQWFPADGRRRLLDVGYYARPEAVDWDNDGWVDLWSAPMRTSTTVTPGTSSTFMRSAGPISRAMFLQDANTNGFLECGELCSLTTVLTNAAGTVTGVVATLHTTNPCAVLSPPTVGGRLRAEPAITNIAQPFSFTIAHQRAAGRPAALHAPDHRHGGRYRQTHALSFEVARPSFSVAAVLVNDAAGNGDCALQSR